MSSSEMGTDARPESVDEPRAWSNPFLALGRLGIFGIWTFYCYSACLVARVGTADASEKRVRSAEWTHRWLRTGASLLGIRVDVRGAPPDGSALLTPNHLGYFDILAVGAACPVVFVSKADVRSWPILGHLFDMSEHIGITRSDRRSLSEVNAAIADRLSKGMRVCVFLEGTSSNGTGLLPFHASLAQPAVDTGAPLVPVGLRWECDADDVSIAEDLAYWRPEHNFVTHAWRALGLRGIHVTLSFGDPIMAEQRNRKALSAEARVAVSQLLELAQPGD